jgi:hypothetical protein
MSSPQPQPIGDDNGDSHERHLNLTRILPIPNGFGMRRRKAKKALPVIAGREIDPTNFQLRMLVNFATPLVLEQAELRLRGEPIDYDLPKDCKRLALRIAKLHAPDLELTGKERAILRK